MLEQPAFGQRLRALRIERGRSQAAVADGIMSSGYLSRLESGARPPTDHIVRQLADRLGVPVYAFDSSHPAPASLPRVLASIVSVEHGHDMDDLLAEALSANEPLDPAVRWQGLWLLASMREEQGRHAEEHDLLVELVALADELDSTELRARSRVRLARCLRLLGELEEAVDVAGEAYRMSADRPVGDRANALSTLISVEAEAGRLGRAQVHADELCDLTEPLGGVPHVEALWASSTVRIRQGDRVGAESLMEQAMGQLAGHENHVLWVRLRLAAASLYLQASPPLTGKARDALDEVEPVVRLTGSDLYKQQQTSLRAHLAFETGDVDTASTLVETLDAEESLLSFRDQLRLDALRGRLLILRGRVAEGTSVLQDLGQRAEQSGNIELAAAIWRGLAGALAGSRS